MNLRFWAVIYLAIALLAPASRAQEIPGRLPRSQFDVIPPSERIMGERGDISVWQTACRVGQFLAGAKAHCRHCGSGMRRHGISDGERDNCRNPVTSSRARLGHSQSRAASAQNSAVQNLESTKRSSHRCDDLRLLIGDIGGATHCRRPEPRLECSGWRFLSWVEPWSAAFISWVMCQAGLGDPAQFQHSAEHITYVDQSIRAREGTAPDAAFVAFDLGEAPIDPGDLLRNSRAGTQYRSLADARQALGMNAATHCDVVVKMDARNRRVLVIGGNVESGVSLTMLPLPKDPAICGPWCKAISQVRDAHLKLRADPNEPRRQQPLHPCACDEIGLCFSKKRAGICAKHYGGWGHAQRL